MRDLNIKITDSTNPNVPFGVILPKTTLTADDIVDRIMTPLCNRQNPLEDIDEFFGVDILDSSFVEKIEYNFSTGTLLVNLSNGNYGYKSVPVEVFIDFVSADSKGKFYNSEIRSIY